MADVNPIQVQKYLDGVDYPCTKQELVEHAEGQGADDNVLETLKKLPDVSFDSVKDVSKALGEIG